MLFSRNRGWRASDGTAVDAFGAVWIPPAAEVCVLCDPHGKFVQVGLTDNDYASLSQLRDGDGVGTGAILDLLLHTALPLNPEDVNQTQILMSLSEKSVYQKATVSAMGM